MANAQISLRRGRQVIWAALSFLLLLLLVWHSIQSSERSYREVIVVSAAAIMCLVGILALIRGSAALKVGFVIWIWTLGLGYRTVQLTSSLRIHPAEMVLWGLLTLLLLRCALRKDSIKVWLPLWLCLFIPFWLWAWGPGLQSDQPWDNMLAEFRDFMLLIPLFIVAGSVLKTRSNWRHVLLAFYLTGAWIAGMGVVEYVYPGIAQLLPGFISDPAHLEADGGFARAAFSFWGTPAATFVCVLTVPMAAVLWRWWPGVWPRVLLLSTVVLQAAAIYIGGYRSMWLTLGIEFLLFALVRQGAILGLVSVLVTAAGYRLFPMVAQERAVSLALALTGHPIDSSATKRAVRALEALNLTLREPLGHGWAAAGWVHSDFLQVAANLGLAAGLLFAGAYLLTLVRLSRRVRLGLRCGRQGELGLALLLSFIAVGGMLAVEGVEVLPQLVLPVWFVWVLVEIWLVQTSKVGGNTRGSSSHLHPLADVQLRRDRSGYAAVGQVGR